LPFCTSPGGFIQDNVIYLDWQHIVGLFILAIPIACVSRTVVFEEIFRELRDWCARKSKTCGTLLPRKFFYLFTCEYCFSHWATAAFMIMTGYQLMYAGWRGYVIAFFALVFVANAYLNLYSRLRVDITSEKKQIEAKEKEIEKIETEIQSRGQVSPAGDGNNATDEH
jgi:hypothetical protein